MPVHPTEENAGSNLTESVMNNPSSKTDSNASTHDRHATAENSQAHNSKGPVIAQDMPEAESKDELNKRKQELNSK